MGNPFSRKTNKKANTIFNMKTQIHQRAEEIRKQQSRGGPIQFHASPESELFRGYSSYAHFETVGKEPGYESD